ncbi:hypothetical protein [Arthrobacter sp. NPDC056493]|uniref:hypothetical protein n=1 Tax=Arthrobacter sp. NPDC056493 TaxID=3345839 RepID=UPI003671C873
MASFSRFRALAAVASATAMAMMSAAGCAPSPAGEPPCFPPPYSVRPSEARPGDSVTVQAQDAGCNPRYGGNARIQISVTDSAGAKVIYATSAMNDGGGFTYTFVVPARTTKGQAAVTAVPYSIDWCDDTGRNNRVAGAAVVLLQRASCVLPVKPLTIRR